MEVYTMTKKSDEGTVIINGNGDAEYISFDNHLIDYIATSDGLAPTGEMVERRFLTVSIKIMSSAPLMTATVSEHPDAGSTVKIEGQRIYVNASQVIDTLDSMLCTPAGWGDNAKLPAFAQHDINGKSRIYIDLSDNW